MGKKSRDKARRRAAEANPQKPPAKGLVAQVVPDVSARLSLRSAFGVPESPMSDREKMLRKAINEPMDVVFTDLISGATEEDKALATARRDAQRLMQDDDKVRRTLGVMIAIRRCYATAYRELQEAVAVQEVHPMTEDYLIQSAMHHAATQYDEHDLMQGMFNSVMPWLAEVVDKHAADDHNTMVEAQIAEDKARQAVGVPLGFLLDLDSETPTLSRHKGLVLVGWANAVKFVLDKITDKMLEGTEEHSFCVVRLFSSAPKGKDDTSLLVRLAPNLWEGCCNKKDSMPKMMTIHVLEKLPQAVDALICDDMGLAYSGSYVGRPHQANAGDALKGFMRWCEAAGAAFIGGVQLSQREPTDITDPVFEQLKTFSMLRAVTCVVEDGKARIGIVGSLHEWEVDVTELEAYGRTSPLLVS